MGSSVQNVVIPVICGVIGKRSCPGHLDQHTDQHTSLGLEVVNFTVERFKDVLIIVWRFRGRNIEST